MRQPQWSHWSSSAGTRPAMVGPENHSDLLTRQFSLQLYSHSLEQLTVWYIPPAEGGSGIVIELYGQPRKESNTLGQNSLKWLGVSVITRTLL